MKITTKKVITFILILIIIILLSNVLFRFILPIKFMRLQSSSMQHSIKESPYKGYQLCGKNFQKEMKIDFSKYWEICAEKYEKFNITKKEFSKFPIKNGIKKYDVITGVNPKNLRVGNIVVFNTPNSPNPIVSRVLRLNNDGTYWLQGDANSKSLTKENNLYNTDETSVNKKKITHKIIFKISPYLFYIPTKLIEIILALLITKFIFQKYSHKL